MLSPYTDLVAINIAAAALLGIRLNRFRKRNSRCQFIWMLRRLVAPMNSLPFLLQQDRRPQHVSQKAKYEQVLQPDHYAFPRGVAPGLPAIIPTELH